MGNSSALFICAAASSQLTDAEVTASVYRFSLEICCTRQRICYLCRGFVIRELCYHASRLRMHSARGAGGGLFCSADCDADWKWLQKPGSRFKGRCQCLRALPSLPCTHQHLWEVSVWFRGRHRKKYRMGKRTGKRKIAGLEGEGEKWPRKGKWRQTERQRKNCFPFYEEREPSNQDDWVQLFRPLYTHELAIKCGSGKQKTS